MVHFGLTSDDINNLAYGQMVQNAVHGALVPELQKVVENLRDMSSAYKKFPCSVKLTGSLRRLPPLEKSWLYLNRDCLESYSV